MIHIAVFASGGGTDLQAVIDGCKSGVIDGEVCVVISNNPDAYALQRAAAAGIDACCIPVTEDGSSDEKTLNELARHGADMIFLAGYLKKVGAAILRQYHNRVFNIHPALLPKYGGKGMYGINVHRAVIAAGDSFSGVTVHRVNEEYDSGDLVAQTKVAVMPDDTPQTLAARVLEREHSFLPEIIGDISRGKIKLGDTK